MFVSIIHTGI